MRNKLELIRLMVYIRLIQYTPFFRILKIASKFMKKHLFKHKMPKKVRILKHHKDDLSGMKMACFDQNQES